MAFRHLDEVMLASEADGCDDALAEWVTDGTLVPRLWTDAYLAAFARSAGWRLVTFDADFSRFEGLNVLRLHPDSVAAP